MRLDVIAPGHAQALSRAVVGCPDLRIVLPPESTISGRSHARGPTGLRGASPLCGGEGDYSGYRQTAVTGADGAYRLGHLGPGKMILHAKQTPEGLVAPPHAPFTLRTGDHLTGCDFALSPGALVSGSVTAADTGRPVANAWVIARMNLDSKAGAQYGTEAAADGTFRLRVPAGDCELSATRASAETEYYGEPEKVPPPVARGGTASRRRFHPPVAFSGVGRRRAPGWPPGRGVRRCS